MSKIPTGDSTGVARQEIKFEKPKKLDITDPGALHPFLQFLRKGDRATADLYLAPFGLKSEDLKPSIKVKQLRRRVYISEGYESFATITLDRVSYFYFPNPTFVELELELNEIKYSEGTPEERERMEKINAQLKAEILAEFPDLKQDQTPKYNKTHSLIQGNALLMLYDNYVYLIFAALILFAGILYFRYR